MPWRTPFMSPSSSPIYPSTIRTPLSRSNVLPRAQQTYSLLPVVSPISRRKGLLHPYAMSIFHIAVQCREAPLRAIFAVQLLHKLAIATQTVT